MRGLNRIASGPQVIPPFWGWVAWLPAAGYAVFAVLAGLAAPVGVFDDAYALCNALFIRHGLRPYADFAVSYPTLPFYLDAGMYSVLGETAIAHRVVQAILYGLVLWGAKRLLEARFPAHRRVIPAAGLVLAVSAGAALSVPAWTALALALLALFFCCSSRATGTAGGMIVLGLLTAGVFLCRLNFGMAVAMAAGGSILLESVGEAWATGKRTSLAPALRQTGVYGVSFSVFAAVGILAVSGGRPADFWAQNVSGMATVTARRFLDLPRVPALAYAMLAPAAYFLVRLLAGAERFPKRAWMAAGAGVAIVALGFLQAENPRVSVYVGLAEIAAVAGLHLMAVRLSRYELCFLLFYCAVLHYGLSRADDFHLMLLPIAGAPAAVVLVFSLGEGGTGARVPAGTAVLVFAGLMCILWTIPTFLPRPGAARSGIRLIVGTDWTKRLSDADRLLGAGASAPWPAMCDDQDELAAARYVRLRTRETDWVFAGVVRHSSVFVNNVRLYWLMQRRPGVRHYLFDPGVTTEEAGQRRMVEDLERNRVNWVVLDMQPYPGDAGFLKRMPRGSDLLDRYISGRYKRVEQFGRYAVLRK